ncbi:MAG: hypothetical protein IJT91_04555, partial [Clostridia bacterium]|nr:hypothetical protein [Clostridia bacterium]
TIGNVCYCFSAGIGSVALMLASLFHGDEDRRSLHTVIKTMVFYAIVTVTVVTAIVLISAPALVGLFLKDDPEARGMAAAGLRLFSLSLTVSALNTAFKNYYQGVGLNRLTGVISVLQSFVFTALYAVILSRFLGTTGIWLGWVCGETTTLLFICAVVWIKNKKISVSAPAYSLLPNNFGAAEENCLDMTVRTVGEAVEAGEKAEDFCIRHGENVRDSRVIALCIEETANNIVDHGFSKDNRKDHTIEVRLMFRDGKRLIRIRDNCVNFDPVAYMELHNDDDPTLHIGVRLVMKMVKDANYICSLGLNNLTLVL